MNSYVPFLHYFPTLSICVLIKHIWNSQLLQCLERKHCFLPRLGAYMYVQLVLESPISFCDYLRILWIDCSPLHNDCQSWWRYWRRPGLLCTSLVLSDTCQSGNKPPLQLVARSRTWTTASAKGNNQRELNSQGSGLYNWKLFFFYEHTYLTSRWSVALVQSLVKYLNTCYMHNDTNKV